MQSERYFLLKDEDFNDRCYGTLIYKLPEKKFRFILRSGYDFWDYPPILDFAFKRGEIEVNNTAVMCFIRERLIPSNRANILDILRSAGLTSYDEFGMLMYTGGKCAQDWMYLEEIKFEEFKKLEEYSTYIKTNMKDETNKTNNEMTINNIKKKEAADITSYFM